MKKNFGLKNMLIGKPRNKRRSEKNPAIKLAFMSVLAFLTVVVLSIADFNFI